MKENAMIRSTTAAIALCLAAALVIGCTSSGSSGSSDSSMRAGVHEGQTVQAPTIKKRVGARELIDKLESAGLETKNLGAADISIDAASRFPETPRSTMVIRVSDGRGNATPMTFVEFSSWKRAAEMEKKPVNGFAVGNWFVLGIVDNYFKEQVTRAIAG
jgi:hypothetical protein